jgi:class 3 adenylate cyclase
MLLDVAVAPGAPQPDAAALKQRVQGLLGSALQKLPEEGRLAVESGNAAVVCFVSDPQDGLHAAMLLRDEVVQYHESQLSVRVALNIGPVQVASDPQEQLRVTGEGIHHAVEIRDRARPNEVVLSQSYHQLLSQLNPALAGRFAAHTRGEPQPIRFYAAPAQAGSRKDEARQMDITPTELEVIEHTLTRFVGDSALALMRREIERCATLHDFVAAIAGSIEHPQQREVFLQALRRALPERTF